VNIRLHGTREECGEALGLVRAAVRVVPARGPYTGRPEPR